jgi:hypothetical protein
MTGDDDSDIYMPMLQNTMPQLKKPCKKAFNAFPQGFFNSFMFPVLTI